MISEIFTVGIAYLLGIMVPGPSINLILSNALMVDRKASFFSVAGTMVGILLQTVAVITFTNKITENALSIIGFFSSCFLIFLGFKLLIGSKNRIITENNPINKIHYFNSFINAIIIETFNPLALAFFLTILTSLVGSYNIFKSIAFIFEFFIIGIIWFGSIAFIVSSQKILDFFCHYINKIYIVSGLLFIFFGLYGGLAIIINLNHYN